MEAFFRFLLIFAFLILTDLFLLILQTNSANLAGRLTDLADVVTKILEAHGEIKLVIYTNCKVKVN